MNRGTAAEPERGDEDGGHCGGMRLFPWVTSPERGMGCEPSDPHPEQGEGPRASPPQPPAAPQTPPNPTPWETRAGTAQ